MTGVFTQGLTKRDAWLFAALIALFIGTGFFQSWNTALLIFNFGMISAIMALGVNIQWGYAGLFNVGIMGFVALGGLATVLISMPATPGAFAAGGPGVLLALVLGALTIVAAVLAWGKLKGRVRACVVALILVGGFFLFRGIFDPNVAAIQAIKPQGYLGGLNPGDAESYRDYGLMILLAWPFGGLLAGIAAWAIGKTALGLRSDYLAIATLGIAEILVAVLKNEEWLSRGVNNVSGLPRPVPYEVDLQKSEAFLGFAANFGADPVTASSIVVKLAYSGLLLSVLIALLWLAQAAWNSPWGRMMRAIRDNETSANAMGKDIKARHLQVFILGSAICGMAGAMMTTLDGLLTPGSYQPLRFTFLIWVMVIVGGSGNNWGAILGGFFVWWMWVQVEPLGQMLMQLITAPMAEGDLKAHLLASSAHMRLMVMGMVLLLVLRFSPKGLIPER